MSAPPDLSARKETHPPTLTVRLVWWFGIFAAPQVTMYYRDAEPWWGPFMFLAVPGIPFAIPFAILFYFFPVSFGLYIILPVEFIAGCLVYTFHLYRTLKAKTRRSFDYLLFVLVLLTFLSQEIVEGLRPMQMGGISVLPPSGVHLINLPR